MGAGVATILDVSSLSLRCNDRRLGCIRRTHLLVMKLSSARLAERANRKNLAPTQAPMRFVNENIIKTRGGRKAPKCLMQSHIPKPLNGAPAPDLAPALTWTTNPKKIRNPKCSSRWTTSLWPLWITTHTSWRTRRRGMINMPQDESQSGASDSP